MNSQASSLIKVTSIALVSVAIALNLMNLYLYLHQETLPANLNTFFWLGNVILLAHAVEAVIAAPNARSQGKNPWFYGIYTFFVGFIGLQELSE